MLKTIDLMTRGHFVDKIVDLDKLNGTAKVLASMILTTDNRDDTSWVNVIYKIPLREPSLIDGTDPNTYVVIGAQIDNIGAFVNTEFACGMLSVPQELKEMLDLYEALEVTKITIDDLLKAKLSGQFKTGKFIKTNYTLLISKTALKRIFKLDITD